MATPTLLSVTGLVDAAGQFYSVSNPLPITVAAGGGGAVTVADGADVTQGAVGDLASAPTINGLLKNIKAALVAPLTVTGVLTDAQLRATAVPVSGAFYQATQPVSLAASVAVTGTFWQATQPISGTVTAITGGLTDTQLRASPVPVSGTVTATTGGLTDAQLRAAPVPVSGSVTTGGLTDTQLRAAPVPVTAAQGAAAANVGAWPVKITDGVNQAEVTPASTAALAVQPGLVVSVSPNSIVPISVASLPLPEDAATASGALNLATQILDLLRDVRDQLIICNSHLSVLSDETF